MRCGYLNPKGVQSLAAGLPAVWISPALEGRCVRGPSISTRAFSGETRQPFELLTLEGHEFNSVCAFWRYSAKLGQNCHSRAAMVVSIASFTQSPK